MCNHTLISWKLNLIFLSWLDIRVTCLTMCMSFLFTIVPNVTSCSYLPVATHPRLCVAVSHSIARQCQPILVWCWCYCEWIPGRSYPSSSAIFHNLKVDFKQQILHKSIVVNPINLFLLKCLHPSPHLFTKFVVLQEASPHCQRFPWLAASSSPL